MNDLNDRFAYGAAALALVFALARQALFWSQRIEVGVFASMVKKLVLAGNSERALKLCRSAGKNAFAAMSIALIEVVRDATSPGSERRAALEKTWNIERARVDERIFLGAPLVWAAVAFDLGAWVLSTSPKSHTLVAFVAAGLAFSALGEWSTRVARHEARRHGLELYRVLADGLRD
jgi:hypothetical protein